MNTPKLRALFTKAALHINGAHHVVLASPEAPDGDSVGSVLAFRLYLLSLGKLASVYCPDAIPDRPLMRTMSGIEEFQTTVPGDADLIIAFDYGDLARLRIRKELLKSVLVMGFDHHEVARFDVPQGFEIVMPAATSTTQLLFDFFVHVGAFVSPQIAQCLLVGLCTDSGFFRNPLTSPGALRTAAALMEKGASMHAISELMVPEYSVRTIRAWARATQKIEIRNRRALLLFSQKDFMALGVTYRDIAGLMRSLLEHVKELDLAAIVTEDADGSFVGSLRSPNGSLNVANIAAHLGGGGHASAAGFRSRIAQTQIRKVLLGE